MSCIRPHGTLLPLLLVLVHINGSFMSSFLFLLRSCGSIVGWMYMLQNEREIDSIHLNIQKKTCISNADSTEKSCTLAQKYLKTANVPKKKKRCHRYVSFLRRTRLTFNYSSTNIVKTLIWVSGQLVSRSHFKQQRVNLPPAACEHLQVYHVLLVSKLPTSRLIPPCLLGRTCSTQLQQKFMAYKAGIFLQLGHFSWFGYVKGSYCMYVVKYSSQCCHNAALQPVESLTDLHQLPNTQIYSVMAGGSVTHSLFAFTYLAAAHFQSVLT